MTARRITLTAATVGRLDLAIAVATLAVLEVVHATISDGGGLATAIALVPFVAPLAVRRRWPLAALLASAAVVLDPEPVRADPDSLNGDQAVPCSCPTAPARGSGPARILALTSALVLAARVGARAGQWGPRRRSAPSPGRLLREALLVPAWCVAGVIRRDRESAREFSELADQTLALSQRRRRPPSPPSASGSATSCTTSSPTASARWSSRRAARACCCAPTGIGRASR